MTAGRGLIHNEIPAEGDTVHSLQLWVNLPALEKMTEPRYQDLAGDSVPTRREPGAEIRVFSGASGGVTAPTKNHVPVTLVEFRLEPGTVIHQELPADYNAFVVVLEGKGAIGDERRSIVAGDVAWLTRAEHATLSDILLSTATRASPSLCRPPAGRAGRRPRRARSSTEMRPS
jgi:redox-sensitive bicupin YhaK (pirin superfamily)